MPIRDKSQEPVVAKFLAPMHASRSASAAAAGDEIASGSHAMQLRYLQTLGSIANENNSTIIFPVPINLFEAFSAREVARVEQQ